jgi:hypothetical protein
MPSTWNDGIVEHECSHYSNRTTLSLDPVVDPEALEGRFSKEYLTAETAKYAEIILKFSFSAFSASSAVNY